LYVAKSVISGWVKGGDGIHGLAFKLGGCPLSRIGSWAEVKRFTAIEGKTFLAVQTMLHQGQRISEGAAIQAIMQTL
jgi:hypothetical protein